MNSKSLCLPLLILFIMKPAFGGEYIFVLNFPFSPPTDAFEKFGGAIINHETVLLTAARSELPNVVAEAQKLIGSQYSGDVQVDVCTYEEPNTLDPNFCRLFTKRPHIIGIDLYQKLSESNFKPICKVGDSTTTGLERCLNNYSPQVAPDAFKFTVRATEQIHSTLNRKKWVTDPEEDPLVFVLLESSDWLVVKSDGKIEMKPLINDVGKHSFRLVVSDDHGNSVLSSMVVEVEELRHEEQG